MSKPKDENSKTDEVLKRMLETPPKPHKGTDKKPKRKPKGETPK